MGAVRRAHEACMNSLISSAYAQGGGGATNGYSTQIIILVVFVAVFYFLVIRPQQRRIKDQQSMISRLSSGDEVVTTGGILGRITEVGDSFITLEIADGVRVKVQKTQVTQLMPKGTLKSA
jgi:preprotein translocase subunit YajC